MKEKLWLVWLRVVYGLEVVDEKYVFFHKRCYHLWRIGFFLDYPIEYLKYLAFRSYDCGEYIRIECHRMQ